MSSQLTNYDKGRMDSKDVYRKLNLEMDAPDRELFPALRKTVLSRQINLAPFARVDNGTVATHYS